MKPCAGNGVPLSRKIILGAAVIWSLTVGPQVAATELANVFTQRTTSAAKQAAEASAQALGALEAMFHGLRLREAGAPGSADFLDSAASQLADAQKLMQSVDLSALKSTHFNQEKLSEREMALLRGALQTVGFQYTPDTSVAELYAAFTEMTGRLASVLADLAKAEGQPVLPKIADDLALYIRYGALLSRLAQNTE